MGWFSNLFGGKKKPTEGQVVDSVTTILKTAGVDVKMQKGRVNVKLLNARREPEKMAKVLYKLKK